MTVLVSKICIVNNLCACHNYVQNFAKVLCDPFMLSKGARNHDLMCVIIGMYGYEKMCISMHEYLLAPSKV